LPARRRWVKQWTQETLTGFPRQLEADERSVWYDFRSLAGDSCEPGIICAYPGVAYTEEQMCRILKIPAELLQRAKAKMVQEKDISINGDGTIRIVNWEKIQSEYERQKPYRQGKKVTEQVTQQVTEEVTGEQVTGGVTQQVTLDQTRPEEDDITPPNGGARRRCRRRAPPDPRVAQIKAEIAAYFGFPGESKVDPFPNHAKEGAHIKRMLTRGFTPEEIVSCWKAKLDQRGGEFVSAHWVNEDIGKSTARETGRQRLPTTEELEKSWLGSTGEG